jgi:hypothetical protein
MQIYEIACSDFQAVILFTSCVQHIWNITFSVTVSSRGPNREHPGTTYPVLPSVKVVWRVMCKYFDSTFTCDRMTTHAVSVPFASLRDACNVTASLAVSVNSARTDGRVRKEHSNGELYKELSSHLILFTNMTNNRRVAWRSVRISSLIYEISQQKMFRTEIVPKTWASIWPPVHFSASCVVFHTNVSLYTFSNFQTHTDTCNVLSCVFDLLEIIVSEIRVFRLNLLILQQSERAIYRWRYA